MGERNGHRFVRRPCGYSGVRQALRTFLHAPVPYDEGAERNMARGEGPETADDRAERLIGIAADTFGWDRLLPEQLTAMEWVLDGEDTLVVQDRLAATRADRDAGAVHVVRGGKRLARTRHHLAAARLTQSDWRGRWEAERWFCQADGESGKRYGNETIRISPDGEASIKLPAPLAHLANAPHGRYVLACRVAFAHRGSEWADRVAADRAVAYRIHYDTGRDRWYVTASWQIPPAPALPLEAALAHGVVGVDMNAGHLAAWRLDAHGNPTGAPRRFSYDLRGTAAHRDAQVRHALTRLLH